MTHVALPIEKNFSLPFYLAMEEYVARTFPARDYFFMWQVSPTVIFGRNQLVESEVNTDFCRAHNIAFYRRKSGGGCVYADEGNIMFSYITPDSNVNFTFNRYMLMVEHMLQKLGVDARSTGRNDILINGKKVSGNAFYHLPSRSIVHGTMLYDTDVEKMAGATTPSVTKLKSKGVESVRQYVTTLKEHISLNIEEFKSFVRNTLCDDEFVLSMHDIENISAIAQEYSTDEFIYGRNPAYTLTRRRRIDGAGEFEAQLEIKDNTIRRVNLAGDYFATGYVESNILNKLRGIEYTPEAVARALSCSDVEETIMNLKKEQFITILFD